MIHIKNAFHLFFHALKEKSAEYWIECALLLSAVFLCFLSGGLYDAGESVALCLFPLVSAGLLFVMIGHIEEEDTYED